MENNILKHRMAVMNNIAKSFGYEKSEDLLEKAEDNDIEKAKHQDGDMHPNGKWVWRASANGGKGDWRVAKKGSSSTSGSRGSAGASGGSDSRVSAFMSALKVVNSKFTDENKIKVVKTDKGNWDTTYDGHRIGVIRGIFLSEKVAKEKGWLEEDDKDTKKSSNTVTHDINGTKVTVTKNSDGSYTLEANGKKVKSDDPSFFVNGTNLKPRVKAALAKEVGLNVKKKITVDDLIGKQPVSRGSSGLASKQIWETASYFVDNFIKNPEQKMDESSLLSQSITILQRKSMWSKKAKFAAEKYVIPMIKNAVKNYEQIK